MAAGVVTHDTNGQHASSEVDQIIYGVRGATGIGLTATVPQDQHGGLARDARNLAGNEFVENEIADYADGLLREGGNQIEQTAKVDGRILGEVMAGVRAAGPGCGVRRRDHHVGLFIFRLQSISERAGSWTLL